MSEVKRFDIDGRDWEILEDSHGDYVAFSDFDAQRLRADTAEAELKALKHPMNSAQKLRKDLAAAEQRIAELSADNQQLRKLLEQTLAALNPTKALSKSLRVALNQKSEGESQ